MPLRPLTRDQAWILPPSLDELVPRDHTARFVAEFVDALGPEDWARLGVRIDGEVRGGPAYHPRLLLSVWLHGFMSGVRSSRKLEAACREQVPYMWLTGQQFPDHNTLWRFYARHREAMRALLERTVRTAVAMGLVELAVQAVDGTKVGANASLYRTRTAGQLEQLLERLELSIADLESQNEAGEGETGAALPEGLVGQRELRERVREALAELEKQPVGRRVNLTDPDARLMKTPRGIIPGYNAQAMVSAAEADSDGGGMLITAASVVDAAHDHEQLLPMVEQARATTGTTAGLTLADAGYHSGHSLEDCERMEQRVVMPESRERVLSRPYGKQHFRYDPGSDRYVCPEGQPLPFHATNRVRGEQVRQYRASGEACRVCPAFGSCTTSPHGRMVVMGLREAALSRHRAWMETPEARAAYKRRAGLVEPVFGIIKEQLDARRFLLRGLRNVEAEWTVLATAFNLRTLSRAWRSGRRITWTSIAVATPTG
ncbi:MAG: IS1182 family transposase [Gammaproteobacteria bacterium]|nr:IS1182 family transposase [Gammaproteobacteria bacterium]